jgi:cytochrome c551/c552
MMPRRVAHPWPVLLLLALAAFLAGFSAAAAQSYFATPEAAAHALYQAARAGDDAAMERVLGSRSADVVESGNEGEDMAGRARFVAAWDEAMRIDRHGGRRAELVLGAQARPFPYPLVHDAAGWRFDSRAGRSGVVARRIERNEQDALQAALAYVEAQREYALAMHDGVGPGVYAQRLASTHGLHDGLHWMPTPEHPLPPLDVGFALAAAEANGDAVPYHGYFFRVLPAQGDAAPGGAASYIAEGRMTGGFALVAWPARYRVTGVRTFTVSHDGLVYSRDLGPLGGGRARAMAAFDPDSTWRPEVQAIARAGNDPAMRTLAAAQGCTLCHRDAPAPREVAGTPLAPSWREIAARYRGRDAEAELARIVTQGADQRHWKDRHDFAAMGANSPRIEPDEARAIVRWILSSR